MRDGASDGGGAKAEAEAEFRHGVSDIFGARFKAAWLSGSFVYDGAEPGRSDIDVVVVLDEAEPLPADSSTLDRIRAFAELYLAVHARHGLDPDLDFPAEYVSPATIAQAIAWRGLALEGAVAETFPPVEDPHYWIGRPDRWFNAWLSMTAFSRFLAGAADYHEESKLAAWKSILRFLLLRCDGQKLMSEEMWPGLGQFGVKPSYRAFWPMERSWVRRALGELRAEGAVELADGAVRPVAEALRQWERQLRDAIASDEAAPSLLLPPKLHREVAAHAARRWAEMDRTGD